MRRFFAVFLWLAAAALIAAPAGCGYREGVDPAHSRWSWFSYVGGDDIRAACRPGAPERFRFVYNAEYEEQIRTYDLTALGPGEGAMARTRARGLFDIASGIFLGDPLAPLRGDIAERRIDSEAFAAIRAAARADGLGGPPPVGLQLLSDAFYWIATACLDGAFHINGWRHPSPRFAALRFPARLFAIDETGVAVRTPADRPAVQLEPLDTLTPQGGRFQIEIGRNGLRDGGAIF